MSAVTIARSLIFFSSTKSDRALELLAYFANSEPSTCFLTTFAVLKEPSGNSQCGLCFHLRRT